MPCLSRGYLSFGLLTLGDYYNKFAFIAQVFAMCPTLCWSQNGGEEDRLGLYPGGCTLIKRQVNKRAR